MKSYLRGLVEQALGHPPTLRPARSFDATFGADPPLPEDRARPSRESLARLAEPATDPGTDTRVRMRPTSDKPTAGRRNAAPQAELPRRPTPDQSPHRADRIAAPEGRRAPAMRGRARPDASSIDAADSTEQRPHTSSPTPSPRNGEPRPSAEVYGGRPTSAARSTVAAGDTNGGLDQQSDTTGVARAGAQPLTVARLDFPGRAVAERAAMAPPAGEARSGDRAAPRVRQSGAPDRDDDQRATSRPHGTPARSPVAAVERPMARASGVDRMRDMAGHAPAALPDVHIHIGRIELTAISAAAPPPRAETPAATRRMTLDRYLERRDGRDE
jgi:hypothetical protein